MMEEPNEDSSRAVQVLCWISGVRWITAPHSMTPSGLQVEKAKGNRKFMA